jgi:hypothetical protein
VSPKRESSLPKVRLLQTTFCAFHRKALGYYAGGKSFRKPYAPVAPKGGLFTHNPIEQLMRGGDLN